MRSSDGTRTEPMRATRPMSLRSRSVIITFSARSFNDAASCSAATASSPGRARAANGALHRPALHGAAAQVEEQLGRRADEHVVAHADERVVAAALRFGHARVEVDGVAVEHTRQSVGEVDLVGRAAGDDLADVVDRVAVPVPAATPFDVVHGDGTPRAAHHAACGGHGGWRHTRRAAARRRVGAPAAPSRRPGRPRRRPPAPPRRRRGRAVRLRPSGAAPRRGCVPAPTWNGSSRTIA